MRPRAMWKDQQIRRHFDSAILEEPPRVLHESDLRQTREAGVRP